MATGLRTADGVDAAALARTVLGVPFRLQTYRNLCYLALALPLGLVYFVLLAVGISLGVALAVVLVGVPILLGVLAVATRLAAVERWLARWLLGVEVPTRDGPEHDSLVDRTRALVTDLGTWTAVVFLGTKLFVGVVAVEILLAMLVTAVSMLAVPFVYDQPGVYVGVVTDAPVSLHPAIYVGWDEMLVGVEAIVELSAWQIETLPAALAVAGVGVVLGLLALHLLNALAWLSGRYTRLLLGDRSAVAEG